MTLRLEDLDRDGALREAGDRAGVLTRGTFLRGLGLGGAAAAAASLAPAGAAARTRGAHRRDAAILNYALVLEYLQAAFYSEAERAGALHGALRRQARVVGAHERAHVAALRAALGHAAVKRPAFDFRGVTEDPGSFRRTAVAFEDLAVAAYKEQLPRIASDRLLVSAVQIHSVEARHASWIRRLAGRVPSPDAFDDSIARPEVEHIVAGTHFVVARPRTTTRRRGPKFTG